MNQSRQIIDTLTEAKAKIIGKTRSGKLIYVNPKHPSHSSFSFEDHADAESVWQQRRVGERDKHFKDINNPQPREIKSYTKADTKIFKAIEFHSQQQGRQVVPVSAAASVKKNVAAVRGLRKAGFR